MNYYIRKFHFKRTFFGKTYIYFEFYLGDKWRKAKINYVYPKNSPLSISDVSSLIISYIQDFIGRKKNYWDTVQLKSISALTEQFGRDTINDVTRLYK